MKATPLQKEIIVICEDELLNWRCGNDITSPTHDSDAEASLLDLYYDGELSFESCEEINLALQKLRHTILKVTKNNGNQD